MDDDRTEVLISALEHYSYCPRQCALIHVEQTYEENLYTMRGSLAHARVDSGDTAANRGVPTTRGIPLWSEHYGLRGKADTVEWHDAQPYPVEYKVGRRRGEHADVQLCAQALCLEEMFETTVPAGAIYSVATRRRSEIRFDAGLRERTIAIIAAVRIMLDEQQLPAAPNDERCTHCSLIHACLPQIVTARPRLRAYTRTLFNPLGDVLEDF